MAQYRDSFYALVPPWLSTGNAEKYMYTLGLMRDFLVEKANQAIKIRWPGQGDASQIPYLAFDRVLEQGPLEPNAGFLSRVRIARQLWDESGSARSVLWALQAHIQGFQPGVAPTLPELTIVSTKLGGGITVWNQLYQGDALLADPTLSTVPTNFDWDGADRPWRAWLVIPQYAVATGLSGSAAHIASATGGSFSSPGQNVAGVWVPTTSGSAVNTPFVTLTGLAGLSAAQVGQMITIGGAAHTDNDGTFQIAQVLSATSCVIVNPLGGSDSNALTWSIAAYPWIAPGPAWGTPGVLWGQGEAVLSAKDTGSNVGGVWKPTVLAAVGGQPSFSWGLYVSSLVLATIRGLVKTWKSAGTYYPNFVVAFDGGDGTAGSAYSPNSSEGAGNPDGTFGSVGKLSGGVWVPTRLIASEWDCYVQGTGTAVNCGVENLT
jgi:hypothetical protein